MMFSLQHNYNNDTVIIYDQLLLQYSLSTLCTMFDLILTKSLWGEYFPVEEAETQRDEVIRTKSHNKKVRAPGFWPRKTIPKAPPCC